MLDDVVVFRRLVLDEQPVLEAAASPRLDAHAEPADIRRDTLGIHETLDLDRGDRGHGNDDIGVDVGAHDCLHLR